MKKFLLFIFLILISSQVLGESMFWDLLRPEVEIAKTVELPVKLVVFLLSLFVFAISALAYSKSKSKRILLVSFAFFLFTLKWLVKIMDIFYSPGDFLSDESENIFELGILLSLLIALFYKKSWNKFFDKGSAK